MAKELIAMLKPIHALLPLLVLYSVASAGATPTPEEFVRRYPGTDASGAHLWILDPTAALGQDAPGIRRVLDSLRAETGAEMAVIVLPQTEGLPLKDLAVQFFQSWKLGRAGKDNGVLILHALDQRRVEVEVGYGLEGDLPDVWVSRALNRHAVPELKAGRIGQAHARLALALRAKASRPDARDDQVAAWVDAGVGELATGQGVLATLPIRAADPAPVDSASGAPPKPAGSSALGWAFIAVIGGLFAFLVLRGQRCRKCSKRKLKYASKASLGKASDGTETFRYTYKCAACGAQETRDMAVGKQVAQAKDRDSDNDSRGGRSGGAGAGASY